MTIRRSGHVALIGRPNTGKSTLLNRLVGMPLSITADRPQTTRHRILGLLVHGDAQIAFVDSPGFQTLRTNPLNRLLNRTAHSVARQADVVVLVARVAGPRGAASAATAGSSAGGGETRGLVAADLQALKLAEDGQPVILALNAIDLLQNPNAALPVMARVAAQAEFAAIVPISARTGAGLDALLSTIVERLPEQGAIYDAGQATDRSERFLAAEIIREKLFRLLGAELPYESTVVIDRFEQAGELRRIAASIVVERRSHKPIVLGPGGERIKRIGTTARVDMERLFDARVHLTVWVRVRKGWAQDEARLRSYGYE
ncbi:MAG: GTPase Era [Burkholderiaceae bacterium]